MGAKKSPRVDDDDDVGGGGASLTTVALLVASREEEAVAPISRRSWLPASHLRADAGVVFSRTRKWERGSGTVFPLPFSRNFLRERKQKWREIARPRRSREKKKGGGGNSPLFLLFCLLSPRPRPRTPSAQTNKKRLLRLLCFLQAQENSQIQKNGGNNCYQKSSSTPTTAAAKKKSNQEAEDGREPPPTSAASASSVPRIPASCSIPASLPSCLAAFTEASSTARGSTASSGESASSS